MTLVYDVYVPGEPKAQPRPRVFKTREGTIRACNPLTAEGWKSRIAYCFKDEMKDVLSGPVRVDITFLFPRPKAHFGTGKNSNIKKENAPAFHTSKPDRDNLEKAVLDTLTSIGIWNDDCQVCSGEVKKLYADAGPGAIIRISSI